MLIVADLIDIGVEWAIGLRIGRTKYYKISRLD
jgi:hypothetical protein